MPFSIFFALLVLCTPFISAFPTSAGTCTANTQEIGHVGMMGAITQSVSMNITADGQLAIGKPTKITISGEGTFRGLLLYAARTQSDATHLGQWTTFNQENFQTLDGENAQGHDCKEYGMRATLSHKSSVSKNFPVEFQWTPNVGDTGSITVFAIVVLGDRKGFSSLASIPLTIGANNAASPTTFTSQIPGPDRTIAPRHIAFPRNPAYLA
ncbi:hypothetical protein DFS34DRAFT_323012 [Phlyctochytrium arcticum]|nr:hypothetical protein DFS34DRAFT_323012 [Phlyctochytrium arcticum]